MLYDPKWDKPSVSGIITFLATLPAGGKYDYLNCYECGAGKYLESIGRRQLAHNHWELRDELPKEAYATIFASKPWTFGAALERAREFKAS